MAEKRRASRAPSYFHISDNLLIKFDNNDKKGNLGNQWRSLILSHGGDIWLEENFNFVSFLWEMTHTNNIDKDINAKSCNETKILVIKYQKVCEQENI